MIATSMVTVDALWYFNKSLTNLFTTLLRETKIVCVQKLIMAEMMFSQNKFLFHDHNHHRRSCSQVDFEKLTNKFDSDLKNLETIILYQIHSNKFHIQV